MSDLVRFGVAMERGLLAEFDERIAQKGYENRSEALRDLVRADLTRAAREGGAAVAGTLTIVYSRKQAESVARMIDTSFSALRPNAGTPPDEPIVSTLRVALDATRTLEVLLVKGPAARLGELAGRIGGARGVLSSELAIAAAMAPDPRPGLVDREELP